MVPLWLLWWRAPLVAGAWLYSGQPGAPLTVCISGSEDIKLWSLHVTAAGMAELFWPRSHIDVDGWYTILVVIDLGECCKREFR